MTLDRLTAAFAFIAAFTSSAIQWWLLETRLRAGRRSGRLWLLVLPAVVTSVFAVGYLAILAEAIDYVFLASRVFRFALIGHFVATAGLVYYTHCSIEREQERRQYQVEIMQQRLLIAEERSHLTNLQEQFIQNVSHEMRTPLSVLKGLVELLLLGQFGELSPDERRILAIMARRVDALINLVNQMISIMQTGQYADRGDFVPLAMDVIVSEIVGDMAEFAAEHNLGLSLEHAEHGICFVHPDLVHQALGNVLFNAIKFTEPAGAIGVSATVTNGCYEITVTDTGIGIPEAELTRVFDRFYQVDGSSTRKYGGTGLGLAVVRYVVEFVGGKVEIESTERVGTTVRLLFPLMK